MSKAHGESIGRLRQPHDSAQKNGSPQPSRQRQLMGHSTQTCRSPHSRSSWASFSRKKLLTEKSSTKSDAHSPEMVAFPQLRTRASERGCQSRTSIQEGEHRMEHWIARLTMANSGPSSSSDSGKLARLERQAAELQRARLRASHAHRFGTIRPRRIFLHCQGQRQRQRQKQERTRGGKGPSKGSKPMSFTAIIGQATIPRERSHPKCLLQVPVSEVPKMPTRALLYRVWRTMGGLQ